MKTDAHDWREFGIGLGGAILPTVLAMGYDLAFTPEGELGIIFLFSFTVIPLWIMVALAIGVSVRRTRGLGLLIGVVVGLLLTVLFLLTPVAFIPGILFTAITGY